jgi:hypothetical protein
MVVGTELSADQQAGIRDYLDETGTIKGDNAARLRGLAAPVRQRAKVKQLVGDLAAEARSYQRAAAAGATDDFLGDLSEAGVRHAAAEKAATALGADDCASLGGFGSPDSSFYLEASLGAPVFAYCIDTAEAGNEVSRIERTVAAGAQLSGFVNELFTSIQQGDFGGTVTVRAAQPLSIVAIAFGRDGVVTIPVSPIE